MKIRCSHRIINDLPLFSWADRTSLKRANPAAEKVALKCGCSLIVADLIATHAGLGPKGWRR